MSYVVLRPEASGGLVFSGISFYRLIFSGICSLGEDHGT